MRKQVNKKKKIVKINTKIDKEKKNVNRKNKTRNTREKKTEKREKKKIFGKNIWRKLLTILLILGIVGILLIIAFFAYIAISSPEFKESAFANQDQTIIYDVNGNLITTIGLEKRESISYDKLPQVLVDAIIATEDSRFFQHNGVDLPRFLKASVLQLMGKSFAGGASTLTMQIVKNNLTSRNKSIIRKFQDVYLAVFKVEKKYSKQSIIEFYVNDSYLGGGVYGVEEASKYYFNKHASELTLPEAALIAGLFQSPTWDNPYNYPDNATKRRNTVLSLMYRHGYITKEEKDLANSIPIESLLAGVKENESNYQGYIDTVIDEVIDITGDNPYKTPMKIYTAMERSIQDGINDVFNGKTYTWENDAVQAGVAVINVETGAIAAVGAGRNREGERTYNYATQAKKQPGSTAKPLFDYGPGMEYNNFSTYTLFTDEPWSYTNGPSIGNWDGKFHGLITLRYALQWSRNIPALKAFQQVSNKNITTFVNGLGLDVSLNASSENYKVYSNGVDNTLNEAYAIGGVAEGYSPLQMAAAYSAFASGGYYTKPYTVTKIEYRDTNEIKEFKPTKERVMSETTAYLMNNVLESAVTSGFNGGARIYGSHVAAKTGTSNFSEDTLKKHNLPSWAVNDLWTVAYTSKYSVALWYGYEKISSEHYNKNNGTKDQLMSKIMPFIPKDPTGWKAPSGVVASQVEMGTWPAKLPSEYTPKDLIKTEYFKRGTQPTEVSERFMKINDIRNVTTSKIDDNTIKISWEFDVPKVLTDNYINEYFNQSVFGNSKQKFIADRKAYNNDTLGPIVFAIYQVLSDGSSNQIETVTENSYTYYGTGATTLLIKAQHKSFTSTASNGIKVNFTLSDIVTPDPSSSTENDIRLELNGLSNVTINKGTKYEDKGIRVLLNNVDIYPTVRYQIVDNGVESEVYTKSKLEDMVSSLDKGRYQIKYSITYDNFDYSINRNLTVIDNSSSAELGRQ